MSLFISFEGPDGSGKSTQARELATHLRGLGLDVILTREPGGSPGAEEIRRLILSGEADKWSAVTECLLFTAARRDHIEKTIRPALDRGAVVITDRYADSARAYQGATREDLLPLVEEIHRLAIGMEPDITVMMTPSGSDALSHSLDRALSRGPTSQTGSSQGTEDEARFERMGLGFQERVAAHFRRIAAEDPYRCVEVASEGTIEEVAVRVRQAVKSYCPALFGELPSCPNV